MISTKEKEEKQSDSEIHVEWPQKLNDQVKIKPTFKRHIILLLFCLNLANKSYQWIQISASTAKLAYYYQVDNYVINITSVVFMASFIVLSLPACALIKSIGLRWGTILSSTGTALGSILKCFGLVDRLGIGVLLLGQTLVALSEQFVFSVPNRLVSVWYPDNQLSSALSLSVMGCQLGVAIGFVIPQWFLKEAETVEEIGQGLDSMFLATAVFSTAAVIADYFLFDEEPKHPPGMARLKQIEEENRCAIPGCTSNSGLWQTTKDELNLTLGHMKRLLSDKQILLVNLSYAISMPIMFTVQALLDQAIQPYWPGDSILVGTSGMLLVLVGSLTTPILGYILDRSHRYLLTFKLLTLASGLSVLAMSYAIAYGHSSLAIYICASIVGICQVSLTAAGLELAVELVYPAPELVTASFMNLSPQLIGIPLCFVSSFIIDNYGTLASGVFLFAASLIAWVILLSVKETLQRQLAVQSKEKGANRDLNSLDVKLNEINLTG